MVGESSRPVFAVAIIACVVLGSLGLFSGFATAARAGPAGTHANLAGVPPPSTAPKAPPVRSAAGLDKALAVEDALRAKGISPATVRFPNFAGAVTDTAQPIQPSYVQAPAPMGVADIGLENRSGVLTPYELNTTSVAGTVNITNLQSLYVDGDGPDTFGIQLNSVVNGVTIFGNSSYEFWSQNYVGYELSTHQLTFGDEVWNFSNSSGLFPSSSVYGFSPNGTTADFPSLYQGYGPTITIAYPFTLTLYLNTSTIADRPALYFNFTVSNDTFRQSNSYDYLIFNSTLGTPSQAAPTPYYQANGYNYDPIGLINDMEIDLLGNDNGDSTSFLVADATLSLQYWNATASAMQEVPSAFNAGQETGETSVGLLVYSSGGATPIGIVRSGPALVGGLWNYSGPAGAEATTVTVHPVGIYSFLFVNLGTLENDSTAQWVPTSTTGQTTFYLPAGGTYYLDFLMSDFAPAHQVVTVTGPGSVTLPSVHLAFDPALGIYTPLFAFTNAEVAGISTSGAGTAANPYILLNNQPGPLAPQFGSWNDYLFPTFPGLLIAGTSAWVQVTPPSFEIDLPSWDFAPSYIAALGLPLTNDLQLQFYNASNISLVRAAGISGWMSSFQYGFPESSVMVWGCTNVLVASNTFLDQGNALLLYGGTNNTVWGNTFLVASIAASNPGSVDDSGAWVTGVNETESGDMVYNNYFDVPAPAFTPTVDPYPCDQYGVCNPVTYTATWNVSEQPASNFSIVNGWNLTGSIIGTSYQGGNYWSNYGTGLNLYGFLPYNDNGWITSGGDYVPLIPFTLYAVTFQELGITGGLAWGIIFPDGTTTSTTFPTLTLDYPNGTYNLEVLTPYPWAVTGAPSQFSVSGAPLTVDITFTQLVYVTVSESGLPEDLGWSVSINGTGTGNSPLTYSNVTSAISFWALPGRYNLTASAYGYNPGQAPYLVTIPSGATYGLVVTFIPIPGTLDLHVTPANASVFIDGSHFTPSAQGEVKIPVPPGVTSIEALAFDYQPYFENLTVAGNATTVVVVSMVALGNGTLSLTVTPSSATLWVDTLREPLTGGTYSAAVSVGTHLVEVLAPGYYPYFNNVTVAKASTIQLVVSLIPVSSGSSSSGPFGISTSGWLVIALVSALAVVFLIGMVYYARRPRGRAPSPTVAPAQPWQESPPDPPSS